VNHDDDRVGRDYRAANAALDERPAPATRAAILAAAAREAKARPREDAGSSAPRRAMQRWPMAAAAAVLLSTLAALLTVRTEREMPSFTAPAADEQTPPTSPAVRSPPSVSGPAATPPAAVDATMPRAPATVQRPPPDTPSGAVQPGAKPNAPALAKRTPSAPVTAEMQTARDQPRVSQEEARDAIAPAGRSRAKEESGASSTAPAAMPAEPAASGAIEARPANRAAAPPAAVAAEKQRQDRAERANAAPLRELGAAAPGAPSGSASAEAAATVESDTSDARSMRADDWLEKIIKLRREGRQVEADEELKLFRERFPQVRIPADALGPTGTR